MVNKKNAPTRSSSEMQLKLALALVILGFEERVDTQTRAMLELDQEILHLTRQRDALQEQRAKDMDYLAVSMKHLFPSVSLTLSGEGRVEIPSAVLQQLQQLQHTQHQSFLASTEIPGKEQESGEPVREMHGETSPATRVISSSIVLAEETQEKTDIDPEAKKVLTYLFSQPQDSVLDWKTTVQRALDLPEPPKLKSHKAYKAVQHAYHILESMHEGEITQSSISLKTFYTEYFIEGERWGDLKDTMSEWGIV
jgi:hypothetical protein